MNTNTRWLCFIILFCIAIGQGASYAVGSGGQGSGLLGVILMIAGSAILVGGKE